MPNSYAVRAARLLSYRGAAAWIAAAWVGAALVGAALVGPAQAARAQETVPAAPAPEAAPASGTLTLVVRAKGDGRPLKRVEVKRGEERHYTDPDGKVVVPGREVPLLLYKEGFEPHALAPADMAGVREMEIFLFPATPADNEVIIVGQRRPETSRRTISVEEAVKVAPGGDPAQVPRLLPGVQGAGFRPEVVVRGSGPYDTVYDIEEWGVPFIFHRIGSLSILPDQLISDVEFSSGGFGAQDGNATGGVIRLRTKGEVPERPKTEVRVNVPVLSGIYHERPVGDAEAPALFAVSARRSYLEAFLKFFMPKDADLTVVPYFGDTHLYYHRPTDDGHVKVLGLYAYDGLKAAFGGDAAEDEDGRGRFSLLDRVCLTGVQWKKGLSRDWSLTVSPKISDVSSKVDVVGNRIHIGATAIGSQAELTRRLGGRDKLYVGAALELTQGRADVLAPKPDFNDPFFDFEEAPKVETKVQENYVDAAGWVATDKVLGPLFVTPGVRAFYASRIKRADADPRLNVRYELGDGHALKAATGRYSQAPEFRDASEDFGNPKLHFVRSYHYVLGLETQWSDRWLTDFQGFYKDTKGLVRSDPETNTNNDGALISYGGEAFVRRNLTQRFFGWLAYTWSRSRERDSPEETYRDSQYDQTHVVNLVGNYKLTARWETGGRIQYHTGDTYTTVDSAVYNANLDKYQPRTDPSTRLYEGRLPPYHEADLFVGRDVYYDTWRLAMRWGVQMLAAERQVMGVQYSYDYSETEYFRGIPPIPYFEIRGVF